MNHLNDKQIYKYINGEGSSEQNARIELHASFCETCKNRITSLSLINHSIQNLLSPSGIKEYARSKSKLYIYEILNEILKTKNPMTPDIEKWLLLLDSQMETILYCLFSPKSLKSCITAFKAPQDIQLDFQFGDFIYQMDSVEEKEPLKSAAGYTLPGMTKKEKSELDSKLNEISELINKGNIAGAQMILDDLSKIKWEPTGSFSTHISNNGNPSMAIVTCPKIKQIKFKNFNTKSRHLILIIAHDSVNKKQYLPSELICIDQKNETRTFILSANTCSYTIYISPDLLDDMDFDDL